MSGIFVFLIPLALAAVALILAAGIFALFRGGEFGRTWSNRLMRWRVVAQGVALVVLVAAALSHGHGQ